MKRKFEYDNIEPVKTKQGMVKGYKYEGIHIFKGIPYAEADRFQRATAVEPWVGIKDTTSFGPVAPLMSEEKPSGELLVPHMYWPQNEDCLSLNIWTKNINDESKKPVMVWLHGGGYTAGSSIEQVAYDGANMADNGDVVVVTLNHRLNILGFLDLSPFDVKYENSGNIGLADIVDALKWIQENITEFGGDPDNITLFGQSGGGMKISALMQIPEAEGLFHKGIMMSGIAGDFMKPSVQGDGTKIVTTMLNELDIAVENIEEIETVPYDRLVEAYKKSVPVVAAKGGYIGNNPMINEFFLGEAHKTIWTEQAKNTPIIIGSVFGEFSSFSPSSYDKLSLTDEETEEILNARFGEATEEIVKDFKHAYPKKHPLDVMEIDTVFRPMKKEFIEAKTKYTQAPTYSYIFDLKFPLNGGQNAWHCSDIPFVFHNTDKVPSSNIEEITERLEDQIFKAVISFACTGDPNHEGIPEWKPSTIGNEETIVFSEETRVVNNFDHQLMTKLQEVLPELTLEMMLSSMSDDIQH